MRAILPFVLMLLLAAPTAAQERPKTHAVYTSRHKTIKGNWWGRAPHQVPVNTIMGNYGQRIKAITHTPFIGYPPSLVVTSSSSTTTSTTTTTTSTTTTTTTPSTTTPPTTTEAPETTTFLNISEEYEGTTTITTIAPEITTVLIDAEETTIWTTTLASTTTIIFDYDTIENSQTYNVDEDIVQERLFGHKLTAVCEFDMDINMSVSGNPFFWPETQAGQFAIPNRPCLTSEFLFVTRECRLIKDKAAWAKPNGTCDSKVGSTATTFLYSSDKEGVTAVNVASVTRKMASALGSASAPSPADILIVDKLFGQIELHSSSLDENSLADVGNVLDSVISSSNSNEKDFEKPHLKLATNSILQKVDGILEKIQLGKNGIAVANSKSTSLMAVDMGKSGFSGAQISGSKITPLTGSQQASDTSATFLVSSSERASFILLDSQNGLFKSQQPDVHLNSRVLGVNLKGQNSWSSHNSPIVRLKFKPDKSSEGMEVKCAYWDIFKSEWKTDGCRFVGKEGDLDVCECNHLTHFGEIIGAAGENKVLDVISIVGCSLSLLGLIGIAATAVVFEHWRSRLGNKILLNLAASIGLTMAVFLSIALDGGKSSNASCITLGVLLHYSVLASFCWMLVSASLQFLRFVVVLSSRPPHFLLKGVLFGWILPMLPIIVLLSIGPSKSYPETASGSGFCYPKDLTLILAVILPVACAVIGNLVVFCIIVYRVSCGRPKNLTVSSVTERHKMALRQVRMSVLLFFLLGLTWIFGLLAMLAPSSAAWRTTFSYLFCTTATLQGLALFLFFIVWEKKTRSMWLTTLPDRFVPARTSRPTTTSTAYSESSQSTVPSKTRDEMAPLRQRGSEFEMRRNFGTNGDNAGTTLPST